MYSEWPFLPIIIVSYRTPDDVAKCLTSLDALRSETRRSVHICENGGAAAWDDLCAALVRSDGPCTTVNERSPALSHGFGRVAWLKLRKSGCVVMVGQASENLGYAGGINTWLLPLMQLPGWQACWFLNPDTQVESETLCALVAHAANRNLGLVGSRIMAASTDQGNRI
jgi:N-acetylglucosaminyl-diphospho-decaprenol L-rhamnosyltransferase